MKFFGFRGGVHPPENKLQTANLPSEDLKAPKMLYIPLQQHIGAMLEPTVKVGETVLKGQKIADSQGFLTSPIHSSVSGVVKKIDEHVFPLMGKMKTIFIENDEQDTWAELEKIDDWKNATKEELLAIIREKGIVGIGGATFPTHIKLNPPADTKIDTLILNGAECEPYLNSDNRLMLEAPEKIVQGIEIIKKILGVSRAIIGIEENKLEAISIMSKAVSGTGIEVVPLKTKYPQGGEKQLIKALLDRVVPVGKLPSAVGVVVQNTGTACAIYDAVVNGIPLIEKIVTVSGLGVTSPKNLKVAIGTPISCLLENCGVNLEVVDKLVMGGPMMGVAQSSLDAPVIKGTSGLLALTQTETNSCKAKPCLSCGKCVDVCPMGLVPLMFNRLANIQDWAQMKEYNLMNCIECGSCVYICPANRPLTEAIKLGKSKLRAMK